MPTHTYQTRAFSLNESGVEAIHFKHFILSMIVVWSCIICYNIHAIWKFICKMSMEYEEYISMIVGISLHKNSRYENILHFRKNSVKKVSPYFFLDIHLWLPGLNTRQMISQTMYASNLNTFLVGLSFGIAFAFGMYLMTTRVACVTMALRIQYIQMLHVSISVNVFMTW